MSAGRNRVAAAWLLAVALLAGCGSGSGGSAAGHATAIREAPKLHGNELLYGASAKKDSSITYQPDVVLLGGGANSIKSVSSDALVWTIDGGAPNADEVKVGKVLFATSFGAGRVLGVDKVGSDLRVALGPVALTDVIEDGSIGTDTPIPLSGFEAYSAPDQPGLETDTTTAPGTPGTAGNDAYVAPAVHLRPILAAARSGTPQLPSLPAPAPKIPPSQVGDWHITSICCTSNGVHVTLDKGGARVVGTAEMKFTSPSISASIDIGHGHILEASAKINGAASLRFGISAAVQASAADFHGGRIELPVDIAIPVFIGAIPFTIGVQQLFSVSLGLSGQSLLATNGEYALSGGLGFDVHDGVPSFSRPSLKTTVSALDNVQSLAVAPQALTFAYGVKFSIGIGPPLLSAGVWYQMSAALAFATSGAQLDPIQGTSLVTCKTLSLSILGRYGVGYQIPDIVAKAINLFLRAVMSHPPAPVQPTAGPSWGPSVLFQKSTPPCSHN